MKLKRFDEVTSICSDCNSHFEFAVKSFLSHPQNIFKTLSDTNITISEPVTRRCFLKAAFLKPGKFLKVHKKTPLPEPLL